MDIITWYLKTVGEASVNAVAMRCNINQSTLNRQLKAGRLEPAIVVPIARTYGRNVIDALIVQGLITEKDAKRSAVAGALSDASDEEIADEVFRRLSPDRHHQVFDSPHPSDVSNVVPLRSDLLPDATLAHPELTTDIDAPTSPSGGVFEVYDGSQPPERSAAQVGNVGAEQGTPDNWGEDSQLPPEDWDD